MELVAMATDLAEFLGAALSFNLLFGIPLWIAGLLTVLATFLILGLERYGFRPIEAVITALVSVIAVSYLVETILDKPAWGQVLYHAVVPQFAGAESVLIATGILGATVMPHVIFLHSALPQGRIVVKDPVQMRRLFNFEVIDVALAVVLSFGLTFAVIPLILFTRRRDLMGPLVNKPLTTILAGIAAAIIIALNLFLLYQTLWRCICSGKKRHFELPGDERKVISTATPFIEISSPGAKIRR
jgi:Mn2+/Fe2+ NRAMP family transporter